MNAAAPDRPEPTPTEEALGEQVDRYLDAQQAGREPPPGPELGPLRQVTHEVQALNHYLAAGAAEAGPAGIRPAETESAPGKTSGSRWADLRQLGKYRLSEVLGVGGQAVTYKAWDPDLKRHAVLKLYHAAQTAAQQHAVLKEGQALARVRSPYVAQCHGVERQEGMPYLVIEYIPGQSLAQRQRARPLGVAEALELTAQVAEGLAAVHACGLLHRDLKPGNILVGDDGVPRLVDFGLATGIGDEDLEKISGTLPYMPPEQARGERDRIDARTDLFGLGTVLYYLLTGGPPYRETNEEELWRAARAGDVVPARQRNPKLSRAVNALCMRCLAKDPRQRFATATELVQAIRRWQRRRRIFPWLAGAAAALLVLAAVAIGRAPFWRSPVVDVPRDPDGTPLRQEFPLTVELLGTRLDPAESLHRITEGQSLSFRIESPHACYVGIWYENDEGKVYQLFPNDHDPNHLIPAGTARLIPGDKDYLIRAAPSKGPGRLTVRASTHWWDPLKGRKAGPFVVFATPEELVALRDFKVETKSRVVSENVFLVQVEPR
jgi:serine/threonine protein kinase